MAKSPTNSPTSMPARLTVDQMKAGIARLNKRIEEVEAFNPKQVDDKRHCPPLTELEKAIDDSLVRTFGHDTLEYSRYRPAAHFSRGPIAMYGDISNSAIHEAVRRSKENSIATLRQAVRSLEEQLEEIGTIQNLAEPSIDEQHTRVRRAFVVHGHDEGAREGVARFLEKIGFEAIILHEQPNKGQTIIEKFEANSNVSFAVVLLTPDDVGGPDPNHLQPRARQNVLLELGYFIGRLGRANVCALKRGDLELPTDYIGVAWTLFDDSGAWKAELSRELESAGFEIDWNKVMRQ